MSFSFDKVKTGRYNFVSVIWNSNPLGGLIVILPVILVLYLKDSELVKRGLLGWSL